MGFLDNTSVIVDAILTKHGRKKLAEGNSLGITQFALADDGIDYSTFNVDHPSGSAFYDAHITAMPLIEPAPDDTTLMKYKLFDTQRFITKFPRIIDLATRSFTLETLKDKVTVSPRTDNYGTETEDYIFKVNDTSGFGFNLPAKNIGYTAVQYPSSLGIPSAAHFRGRTLIVNAKPTTTDKQLTVIIEGVTSGAIDSVTITAKANS